VHFFIESGVLLRLLHRLRIYEMYRLISLSASVIGSVREVA